MTRLPGRLVLLGHPVAHSLSPTFQNAALRAAGIALTYEALDVPPDALDVTLARLRTERAAGNVTIPHKEHVAARCDVLSALAERTGAVNTFWCDDGVTLHGENTDVAGFTALALSVLGAPPSSGTIALLGAGGAAAAVCAAAERWRGVNVRIWNRTPERAHRLAARFPGIASAAEHVADAIDAVQVVVNCTPVGLHDDSFPIDIDRLPRQAALLDLVYRRGGTAWVRAARARGKRAGDGLTMLLEQGAAAFELWTGVSPDRAAMAAAVSD